MSNFVTLPGNPGYCELTYSELRKLRDDAQLVPGLQYRITDYECTTTAQDSSSAGHVFDIIVTADSSDTLNENCRATQHADDAYFANNNLEAWELKYSFDGDCTKFAWGPTNSVRSFTFLYSDDMPIAVRYPEGDVQNKYAWNTDGYDISGIYYTSTTDIKPGDYISFEVYNEGTSSFSFYGTGRVEEITGYLLPSEYRGIIFYMKDEYGNECDYDFKNIKFCFADSSSALIDSSATFYYTFTDASTGDDLSMKKDASTICEKNYIGAINDGSTFDLPYTVFIASNSVFNNTIKHASNNVFGVAHDNDMGIVNDCVFDDAFDFNVVDAAFNTWFKGTAEVNHIKYISNSEFGNNFAFNTVRYMSTTKAGDNFMLNDVGDYFINSSFGNNCYSNFFGPYSGTITTGNDFMQNTMQNQCHHLTFGNGCKFNNLGSVGYIRMGNNCTDNFIGNGKYVYFGNSSNQGADWICGNKFEGITQYVYFYNTSSASSSNMLRKYHMYNICGTSDTWKSISETTRNNSKETFVLTRPGYVTPAANSLIYVDPAMLPEKTKGGTAGQILVKVSGTDYDMGWQTVNIGSQIAYDSSNKVISLKDASGNTLGMPIDATDFIKDGMVSDVSVYGGNLVITFNTDAGEDPISIPLTSFFDPDLYYTKEQTDASFVKDASLLWTKGNGSNSIRTIANNTDASITGIHAVALGRNATIKGNYGCVAEGSDCVIKANADTAHAEGYGCTINGGASYSHAEGYHTTINSGYGSHVEGFYTIVNNHSEHASGHYNNSHYTSRGQNLNNNVDGSLNTTFSIGIGTDNNDRRNALEIMQNADTYIVGIGAYDGSNYQNASTLQEVITNLENASGAADLMTNVTYSELKTLRDSSSLVPGMQYRITDYECTTTQANTQSAGNAFDVIVTADSSTELNENARAAHHGGDTYFENCKLEAWELKYSLDNDSSMYSWADSSNGKGVIYYMKDEWSNECPYDFKNIQFKRWAVTEFNACQPLVVDSQDNFYGFYYGAMELDGESQVLENATYGEDFGWYYTFALKDLATENWHDYTVVAHLGLINDEGNELACYDNHLASGTDEYSSGKGQMAKMLNNIVFFNNYTDLSDTSYAEDYSYCNNNRFLGECYSNTFGNFCRSNLFGNYCYSNSFGNIVQSNSFGNAFENNSFGNDCNNNTFGNYCYSNSFGNYCYSNSFGNYLQGNSFGNAFESNSFGNNCSSNKFQDQCSYNTFGNDCHSNTFGNNCHSNTFGNNCFYNSFENYYLQLTVFDGVRYCSVTGGSQNAEPVKNAQILTGTAGANDINKLTITFAANKNYTQIAGKNTNGTLKIWNPADLIN